jgi:KDO2-lipid IV(A) lauroyltransferase
MMLKSVGSYIGLFFIYVLSLLPLQVLYLFAAMLYWVLYYITGYRRIVVNTNLKNSFPEKSMEEIRQIEKRYYKYLAALIFEIIKMSTISRAQLQRRFTFINMELLNQYAENGVSVLACSGHYGNWEWGTLSLGMSYKGVTYPIYKPLSSKAFDQWFNHIRTRFGNKLIAMRQTYRAIAESKDIPTMFLFGNDQAPPKEESRQWMTFLNQQTSVQQGMEKIAIKTNRPVFYLKLSVIKKGYYQVECVPLCLNPAASTQQEITQLHTQLLEGIIREKPEYWLWSHKRWKHQPTQ